MRIDAHQHFWQYSSQEYAWIDDSMSALRRDFLPADLRPELEQSGFDGTIAVQARQTLAETKWLLELAAASSFVVGVVGWVDLQSPGVVSQLAELAGNPKLVGIRHVVQSEPDDQFLLRPRLLRGISVLEKFGLGYDILIYPQHLPVAIEFVQRFPRQRFVLDHLAKPLIKSGVPNVYCKLSGLVTEADWNDWKPEHIKPYLDVALESFGSERLMIGSDWPVCTVAASYSEVMNLVIEYFGCYSDDVRNAVLGGNAAKFWNLQHREETLESKRA
jgi:L-fuconolactonase